MGTFLFVVTVVVILAVVVYCLAAAIMAPSGVTPWQLFKAWLNKK